MLGLQPISSISRYIAILVKYRDIVSRYTISISWLLISIIMNIKTIHCDVMAASKEPTDKSSYHAVGKWI